MSSGRQSCSGSARRGRLCRCRRHHRRRHRTGRHRLRSLAARWRRWRRHRCTAVLHCRRLAGMSVYLVRTEGSVRTVLVVAVFRDLHDLSTDLVALLRNVVLGDFLSRSKSGQGSDNGELLKEHCNDVLSRILGSIGVGSRLLDRRGVLVALLCCLVAVMHLKPWTQLPYILTPKPIEGVLSAHRQEHQAKTWRVCCGIAWA
jgi:hypothetical protein